MKILNHYLFSVLICSSLFFLSSCHEKGCTDPSALNYNIVADVDDGSCIVCNSQTDTLGIISKNLIDTYFSSPHYNEIVATFYLIQIRNKFSYSECGPTTCSFYIKIVSHINSKMRFPYYLYTSGDVSFSDFRNVEFQPNEIYLTENITNTSSNSCGSLSFSTLNIQLQDIIIYN